MENCVYIITRHSISNYGSLLQSIATQKAISKLRYENKIIDYVREDEDYRFITSTLLKNSPKWNKNFLTRMVYRLIQGPEYYLMGRKFEKMRDQYLIVTKHVSKKTELVSACAEAELLLTGSDQVWGPVGNETFDSAYFLDFCNSNIPKVAYAASFGRTVFDENIKTEYSRMLEKYDRIAVRENSAVKVLNDLGLSNVDQVLDPTLLIEDSEWEKLIPERKWSEFVLIYQLHKNADMDDYAKKFAKNMRLPLIRITPTLHQVMRSGKTVFLPDLGTFLGLVKNAKYMITDSFHGTAFAINFGTQFINVLSGTKADSNKSNIEITKTRNQSILILTGLERRVLNSFDDFSLANDIIDYETVHNIIAEKREESFNILKEILEVRK